MASAIFKKVFNATDTKKGISIRVDPSEEPQTFPAWVIDAAVEKGVATKLEAETPTAAKAATTKKDT